MTASEAVNSTEIKPLTKRMRETGELYLRRPDAELQIKKTLTLEKPQITAMLENKRRDDADFLLDETIVYLLREARAANDDEMIETLYLELNERVWKMLAKFRRKLNYNEADFEDFGQKVGMTVLTKIFDLENNAGDYAQINFGDFLISEATVVWRQKLNRSKRDEAMFVDRREDDENEDYSLISNARNESDLTAESQLILREAFGKLTPEQQTVAAMMLDGFQIESSDENELTISRHLNVSSRTIRNWLKEIRATLSDYRGEARR